MLMVMSKEDKTKYKNQFNKDNYARIGLYVKPDLKEALEEHIKNTSDRSVNSFIIRAISETMERDKDGE